MIGRVRRSAPYLLAGATALPMLALLWTTPYVPTHDGPEHLAEIALLRAWDRGVPAVVEHLVPNPIPAPRLHVWVVGALWDALGPIDAQKVFLSLYLLGMPLAFVFLRRSCGPREPGSGLLSGLLGSLLAPSWAFFMGFFDFSAAIPLALLAIGGWLRLGPDAPRLAWLWLAPVFPLVGFAHPFVLGVTGVVCALVTVVRASGRRWRELGRLLLVSAGGLFLLGLVAWHAHLAGAGWGTTAPRRLEPGAVLAGVVSFAFGGPSAVEAALALPVFLAAGLAVAASRHWGAERQARGARALVWAALLLLAAYLAAPLHTHSWAFFQPRFLQIGLCLLACTAGLGWPRGFRLGLGVLALVCALAMAGPFAGQYRRVAAQVAGLAETCRAVPEGGMVLPVVFDPDGGAHDPYMRPLELAGAYASVWRDAVTPYHFAVHPAANPILYRQGRRLLPDHPPLYAGDLDRCQPEQSPAECARQQGRLYAEVTWLLRAYDAGLLWQPPVGLRALLEQHRYRPLLDQGGGLVVVPSLGALVLDLSQPHQDAPIVADLETADGSVRLADLHIPPGAAERGVLDPLPAGPYRLEVYLDRDGDGRRSDADRPARGAGLPGVYAVDVRQGQTLVVDVTW